MTELERIKSILSEHMDELRRDYYVEELGIFGSVARGEEVTHDVDLLVTFNRPVTMIQFIRLERHLESLLARNVDLVTKNGLKSAFRDEILSSTTYV